MSQTLTNEETPDSHLNSDMGLVAPKYSSEDDAHSNSETTPTADEHEDVEQDDGIAQSMDCDSTNDTANVDINYSTKALSTDQCTQEEKAVGESDGPKDETFASGIVVWFGREASASEYVRRADKRLQDENLQVIALPMGSAVDILSQENGLKMMCGSVPAAIILDTSKRVDTRLIAKLNDHIKQSSDLGLVTVIVWDEMRLMNPSVYPTCRVLRPAQTEPVAQDVYGYSQYSHYSGSRRVTHRIDLSQKLMDWIGTPIRKLERNLSKHKKESPRWSGVRCVLLTTGSLNPVHRGHVEMMECAARKLSQKKNVAVVGGFLSPSHDSYLRGKFRGTSNAMQGVYRIRCVQDAVAKSPYFSCDCWEAFQDGFRDFPEVASRLQRFLQDMFPREGLQVLYVCGMDHATKCRLTEGSLSRQGVGTVIVQRPGYQYSGYSTPRDDTRKHVYYVEAPQVEDRSSTKVRGLVRKYNELREEMEKTRGELSAIIHDSTFDLMMRDDELDVFGKRLNRLDGRPHEWRW